jgi:hypothetical protein
MSYTPPVVFGTGSSVTSTDLNSVNDGLRKYINKGIVSTDLATDVFGTTEVVKGEYYNVVPDHQFTTGDMYTQGIVANDNGGSRQYYTSTIKTSLGDAPSPPNHGQWGLIGQYQIIADTGKAIYLEANNSSSLNTNDCAKIIITGHISVRNSSQYVYNEYYTGGVPPGFVQSPEKTVFYLLYKVEGVTEKWTPIADTVGQVLGFEEYANITSTSTDGPAFGTDHRVIPFLFEINVPNVWATSISPFQKPETLAWRFALGCESSIELGWVTNRIMTYEVFYC